MITQDDLLLEQVYDELISEKTIRYSIPTENKQKLMYDFYMLSFLEGVKAGVGDVGDKNVGGRDMKTATGRMGLSEDIEDSFEAAKERLLPYLKEHLLKAVFFAICAELRHVSIYDSDRFRESYSEMPKILKPLFKLYWNRYQEINRGEDFLSSDRGRQRDRYTKGDSVNEKYKDSYRAAIYALNKLDEAPATLVKTALYFFEDVALWGDSYGGDAWARIARGWLKLTAANTQQELYVYIDHVYDLQHNTNTVFNKLQSYYRGGGHTWIKQALDFKANIKSPHELFGKTSKSLEQIGGFILKSDGYPSWEDFLKQNYPEKLTKNKTSNPTFEDAKAKVDDKLIKDISDFINAYRQGIYESSRNNRIIKLIFMGFDINGFESGDNIYIDVSIPVAPMNFRTILEEYNILTRINVMHPDHGDNTIVYPLKYALNELLHDYTEEKQEERQEERQDDNPTEDSSEYYKQVIIEKYVKYFREYLFSLDVFFSTKIQLIQYSKVGGVMYATEQIEVDDLSKHIPKVFENAIYNEYDYVVIYTYDEENDILKSDTPLSTNLSNTISRVIANMLEEIRKDSEKI